MSEAVLTVETTDAALVHDGEHDDTSDVCAARIFAVCPECGTRTVWCLLTERTIRLILARMWRCRSCSEAGRG